MKIALLLIVSFLVTACSAYKVLPEDISSIQPEVVLSGKVKIVTSHPEGNLEQWLSDALVRQKLSPAVITSDSVEAADYVLKLEPKYTGRCFSEPMLTVITLGIIPSVGCAEVGYRIELMDGGSTKITSIDSGREVTTVFGIAAWFLMLSPSWVDEKGIVEYEANSIVKELYHSKQSTK